jgi:hypothetical protein
MRPRPGAKIDPLDPVQLDAALSTFKDLGKFEAARELLSQPHAQLPWKAEGYISWATEGYVARFLASTAVAGIVNAVDKNDLDRLRTLFTLWENDPDAKCVERKSMFEIPSSTLVTALKHQSFDMTKLLLSKGVQVDGATVAQMAHVKTGIDFDSPEVLRILDEFVRHGWDVNALPGNSPYKGYTYPIM